MTDFLSPNSASLRFRAKLAAGACRMSAFAIPLLLLASWIAGPALAAALFQLGLAPDHDVGAVQLLLAAGLSLLPALATAMSLFAVAICFDGFARGDWFGVAQPAALARAGVWLIAAGGASFVVPTLLGLVLSFNAAPGSRIFAVTISSNAILAVLFGVLIWVLGHLWCRARLLAVENAAFV